MDEDVAALGLQNLFESAGSKKSAPNGQDDDSTAGGNVEVDSARCLDTDTGVHHATTASKPAGGLDVVSDAHPDVGIVIGRELGH